MRNSAIEIRQDLKSDTLTMSNVSSETLDLLYILEPSLYMESKYRISASIVRKEGSLPIIVLAYHASSDNDRGQRDEERRFINYLIPLLYQRTQINDIVVVGDFNDNAYVGTAGAYVIDENLESRLADLSQNIVGLGLPEAVICKIRGSLRNDGSFQGPNLYLNQQPKKDGLLVADSKNMVVHIQIVPDKPLVDLSAFNLAEIPTLQFVSQDTGGTDHADATYEVNGMVVVASSFMSTTGFKGFTRVEEKYLYPLTEENRDKQIQSTLVLYELLATKFGVSFDINQSADSSYIINFVKIINSKIDPDKFADVDSRLATCLNDWKATSQYHVAQKLLVEDVQSTSNFESCKLARRCLSKPGKALDTIAQALQGQPCAGYMPEINGHKERVDNSFIDMLHMRKMIELATKYSNTCFFISTTEGGIESKGIDFANELMDELRSAIFVDFSSNLSSLFSSEKKARVTESKDSYSAPSI